MSDKASKKEGTSNEDSDDQYWRCDWQSPETDQLVLALRPVEVEKHVCQSRSSKIPIRDRLLPL